MLDALTIMKDYCKTIDSCSLRDLFNYEKELTGEVTVVSQLKRATLSWFGLIKTISLRKGTSSSTPT